MFKKLLSKPIVKGILSIIPVVGEVTEAAENINGTPKGQIDWKQVSRAIVRLIIVLAILKGVISSDEGAEIIDIVK